MANIPFKKLQLHIPETLADYIEHTVKDMLGRKILVCTQRTDLFSCMIAYLMNNAPGEDGYQKTLAVLEKKVSHFSVHAFAQAVADLEKGGEDDLVTIRLEKEKNSTSTCPSRFSYRVPKWFVKGLQVYYLLARPHFMPDEGLTQWTRRFEGDTQTVKTCCFFINPNQATEFNVQCSASVCQRNFWRSGSTGSRSRQNAKYRLQCFVESYIPNISEPNQEIGKKNEVTLGILRVIDGEDFDYEDVSKAVATRLEQLRYARQCARAEIYIEETKSMEVTDPVRYMASLYQRKQWEGNDTKKVLSIVNSIKTKSYMRGFNPIEVTTGLNHKPLAVFPADQEIELLRRIEIQEWVGICDVEYEKYGRGVMSLQVIQKDDIICDYHGKVVEQELDEYLGNTDNPEYCLVLPAPEERIIDAASEVCPNPAHAENRCLGRLFNHAPSDKNTCNVYISDLELSSGERVVLMKARRMIDPFEQLRFDYQDWNAGYILALVVDDEDKHVHPPVSV